MNTTTLAQLAKAATPGGVSQGAIRTGDEFCSVVRGTPVRFRALTDEARTRVHLARWFVWARSA